MSAANIPQLQKSDVQGCVITTQGTRITLKEKREKVTFINEQKQAIEKIQVDACIKKLADIAKADYAVVLPLQKVWYVELKASKAQHGILQLENTVHAFKVLHSDLTKVCVLTTGIPKQGGGGAKSQIAFKKKCKADLVTIPKNGTITVS